MPASTSREHQRASVHRPTAAAATVSSGGQRAGCLTGCGRLSVLLFLLSSLKGEEEGLQGDPDEDEEYSSARDNGFPGLQQ